MEKDKKEHPHFISVDAQSGINEMYTQWIAELKARYQKSQIKAHLQVNSSMLEFYWGLGHDLCLLHPEQNWGKGILNKISLDLKEAFQDEKGFSVNTLQYIKRWFSFYCNPQIVGQLVPQFATKKIMEQLVPQLENIAYKLGDQQYKSTIGDYKFPYVFGMIPWGHHVRIISHSETVEQALFYIQRTIQENWSRQQLESHWGDYGKNSLPNNFAEQLPQFHGNLAKELFKDEYNLQFIRSKQVIDEKDLEDKIAQNVTSFLLELGRGFAYVGRQMELRMNEETSFFPDLLFYNIRLRCYVVIELKVVDFIPEFAGKINFYVNAVNHLMCGEGDNPTIGLIICSSKDDTMVRWALEGMNNPLAVAAHNILPTAEEIKRGIEHNSLNKLTND